MSNAQRNARVNSDSDSDSDSEYSPAVHSEEEKGVLEGAVEEESEAEIDAEAEAEAKAQEGKRSRKRPAAAAAAGTGKPAQAKKRARAKPAPGAKPSCFGADAPVQKLKQGSTANKRAKNGALNFAAADGALALGLCGGNANEGEVKWVPHFIADAEAKGLFDVLRAKVDWTHGKYMMFGKEVKTPRLLSAMRDDDRDISKAYSVTGSSAWLPEVRALRDRLEKYLGVKLTYAQLNLYRNGKEYIGWHTDSEVCDGDIIASISLGQTRRFCLRHKEFRERKDVCKFEFALCNGALIVMDTDAAKGRWKHCVPKEPKVEGERINITFRVK